MSCWIPTYCRVGASAVALEAPSMIVINTETIFELEGGIDDSGMLRDSAVGIVVVFAARREHVAASNCYNGQ